MRPRAFSPTVFSLAVFSLAVLLIVMVFAAPAWATPPLTGADLAKYQNCETDDDCVAAQNGSCDCNNGGTTVGVNRLVVLEFRKNFEPTTCTTIQGASCTNGIPRCEQNHCLYYARILPHVYTKKKK